MKLTAFIIVLLITTLSANADPATFVTKNSGWKDQGYCEVFVKDAKGLTNRAYECFEAELCISSNYSSKKYPQEKYEQLILSQYEKLNREDIKNCGTRYNFDAKGRDLTSDESKMAKEYESKINVPNKNFYILNDDTKIKAALNEIK